ncbi:unnamed protein product [Prunus armeniaca]
MSGGVAETMVDCSVTAMIRGTVAMLSPSSERDCSTGRSGFVVNGCSVASTRFVVVA